MSWQVLLGFVRETLRRRFKWATLGVVCRRLRTASAVAFLRYRSNSRFSRREHGSSLLTIVCRMVFGELNGVTGVFSGCKGNFGWSLVPVGGSLGGRLVINIKQPSSGLLLD